METPFYIPILFLVCLHSVFFVCVCVCFQALQHYSLFFSRGVFKFPMSLRKRECVYAIKTGFKDNVLKREHGVLLSWLNQWHNMNNQNKIMRQKIRASYSQCVLHYCCFCIPPRDFHCSTWDPGLQCYVWSPSPLQRASTTPAVPPQNELLGTCCHTRMFVV